MELIEYLVSMILWGIVLGIGLAILVEDDFKDSLGTAWHHISPRLPAPR